MKKVLLLLIALILIGIVGFEMYDFINKKNEEKENVKLENNEMNLIIDDVVKLESINKSEDGIVENYKIIINGVEKEFSLSFFYQVDNESKTYSVSASYNGNLLYYNMDEYENVEDIKTYDENMINNCFNESNFKFIKGEDNKNYLVIITNIGNNLAGREEKIFILNDDLEFVNNDLIDYAGNNNVDGMSIMSTYTKYILENDAYPWYTDVYKMCSDLNDCFINVKIEENKIFYLVPDKNFSNLEERVYTIDNGSLEYEVINRYKIVDVFGQVA